MVSIAYEVSKLAGEESWCRALRHSAVATRRDIAEALYRTGGGHYGGSFSAVEIMLTVYTRHLRIDPARLDDPLRDRFVLSKGHAAIGLYAMLRHLGWVEASLDGYASFGSPLEGHPDMTAAPWIDWSTGSLGQGLSAALGMAIGLRGHGRRVWALLGDGECQEGQVWEAAMLAGLLKPDNLHVIVDLNRHQEYGWRLAQRQTPPLDPVPDMAAKWLAFGWDVIDCDGHDVYAIDAACSEVIARARPCVILAATQKGHGSSLTESDPLRFHCTTVCAEEHAAILDGLNLDRLERL
jgi:transketolase